jgi:hypothetical protein
MYIMIYQFATVFLVSINRSENRSGPLCPIYGFHLLNLSGRKLMLEAMAVLCSIKCGTSSLIHSLVDQSRDTFEISA